MQNKNNLKIKYPLATAGKRVLAKALDIIIVGVIVMCIGFAVFCSDPNFAWNQPLNLAGNWRYGLFGTLTTIMFFLFMFVLPIFWKKTIGMKALKLSYTKKEKDKSFVWGLFKHELFVWEIIVFIAFIMGWTLSGLSQLQIDSMFKGVNAMWTGAVPDNVDHACYYVGIGFSVLYGVSILFLIAIIVAICIKNGKPAFHDKYSNILLFIKKPVEELKPWSSKKEDNEIEEKVPGQLSYESLEELGNI